jgi:hypothetical protein
MKKMNQKKTQNKSICVIIGDIHFTPATLELASSALIQAKKKASELRVPLVINGDTLDSKAIIRGECANRLIEILESADIPVYVNDGNHDKLSEKGKETSLNFLSPYCHLILDPTYVPEIKSWIIPYQNDAEEMQNILSKIEKGSRLLIHQGVQTAFLGHYVQDKTSLPTEAFADFRVIASHYHRRQDIKCGRPQKGAIGLFSYIGNPYTLSSGEASDGPKGFQILNDDGTLTPVFTHLRRHIVIELTTSELEKRIDNVNTDDLVWLKVTGPYTQLEQLNKTEIGMKLLGHTNFKLDKIYTDAPKLEAKIDHLTDEQILDKMIDATDEKPAEKKALKSLWREVL